MKQLIINASVFDGHSPTLSQGSTIVIEDSLVTEITGATVDPAGFDRVIDAGGRFVMPGMVNAHVHLSSTGGITKEMRTDEVAIRSAKFAEVMLTRGFTTVRDAGGVVYGLKSSIDNGWANGPRIFPSHAGLSQTAGHADGRSNRAEINTPLGSTSASLRAGRWVVADGVDEVTRAVRDQLFLGASQIKIMAGGGLSSLFDPLLTNQYTFEEMKAIVDAAKDYGTYVMAHLYTNESMQRAAKAGVMSFEHATFLDEETAKIVAEKGIWICPQPQFMFPTMPGPDSSRKKSGAFREMLLTGESRQTELILKYNIPFVFGTDAPFAADVRKEPRDSQISDIASFKKRFGNLEGLRSLTGNANELFKLSTYQNPYPEGKIGLLSAGAFADICIVEGNPVEDLDILAEPDNMKLVMKNGVVYKNILAGEKGAAS